MAKHARNDRLKPTMAAMLGIVALLGLCPGAPARAQEIPACALTGSMTMMIGGKPALRLSDVSKCPPDLYEVISSVQIDGQPMVHFKPGMVGKLRCITVPNPSVTVENKQATALGDVGCSTVQ